MIIKNYQEVKAEPVTDAGAEKANVRWVIAEKDGAKNFFMRVFEIEPGGYTPLHHHPWEHEIFVYEGKGCVVKQGKEVSLVLKDQWFSFLQTKNTKLKIGLRNLLSLFALYPRTDHFSIFPETSQCLSLHIFTTKP